MELRNKNIVVAVCGGIAAYKSALLVRELQRLGAHVRVAMTESATHFVTPLTFQALSGHAVHLKDGGQLDPAGMDHIALSRWSDAIIIAPATANIIGKIAHGVADSFVSSLCLAHAGKLALAPAMNQAMWNNQATQENIATLENRGIKIFGPADGLQACGEEGAGRLIEPHDIASRCILLFKNDALVNKKVVITAGPTVEPIDPVRYISNRSSGKMGYAIADAAAESGADVTVVSGPTHLEKNKHVQFIDVETAEQMYLATIQQISDADIFIGTAAVADYTPANPATEKIKKHNEHLSIDLEKTKDILKEIKLIKPNLYCVGFAAETSKLVENALSKFKEKSLDMIVANQVGLNNQGFNSDFNAIEMIWQDNKISIEHSRKSDLARKIIKQIATNLKQMNNNVTYIRSK
ncbi:MAG: bifunctional phosphopantothenoylcysteine decarboxylase/phosphopantothenate--cysteine ligase CoaBC [Pseudomonadota bacterium]